MEKTECVQQKKVGVHKSKKYEMDMCNGPLLGKIFRFSLPLIASAMLQLTFNAADMIVVGRFAGSNALAAVGATGAITNLIINLFIGLSVGADVMTARHYGAGEQKELSETTHTVVLTALIGGIILSIFGIGIAKVSLVAMDTPIEILDQSVLYMRIYFAGMPFVLLYNYCSAIMRALGDTKRPLYFLLAAGVINVILNLIMVIVFSLGVAGVAIATLVSQMFSSIMVVRCLIKSETCKLDLRKLKIVPEHLADIVKLGIPAGIQSIFFSISNVMIQSTINSFGAIAMAGNTASQNIESFVSTGMSAFHQAATSFTGQNYGAHKIKRIARVAWICTGLICGVGILLSQVVIFFSHELLGLYVSEAEIIEYGHRRLSIMASTYFTCGVMNVMVGLLRGMGYSLMPMFVTLTGVCVFRIVWLKTIFLMNPTPECLYISYPISWTLTSLVHFVTFMVVYHKQKKKFEQSSE